MREREGGGGGGVSKEKVKQKRNQQVKRAHRKWRGKYVEIKRRKEGGGEEEEEERIRDKQAEHTPVPSQHCWGGCNFTLRQVHNQSPGAQACVCISAHVRAGERETSDVRGWVRPK